ncbi:biotin/lipoyl-binding protein [Aureliella helgolandensis]|uniref:Peptidase family M50 n=1 Tax=Aureliella helgolandensis TaxID=2527968 RepID=A0A518G0C2_9BACT|nr:biotin/lipoyl-binding protein [Aureliella helgolandensis]QDV22049.1 Peptidase family M50 [Aureliella helgolandensis]
MTSMADSLVNSAMRPLQLRRRPDLESKKHRYHGRSYWVVKEPVGLNYYRFHDEEFAILNMLDGLTSLQQIKDRFQSEFAPQRITLQDLQQFVGMLHRSGLVISQATGQGRQLRRRGDEKVKKERLGKLANIFALRFRGIDPERILNFLNPFTWWIFTLPALILISMFGLSALMLVLVNFQEFRTKLPTFEQFFAAHNWIWLGATMGIVKVLHEFGHGLSCKRYGGECHEMGFMFLVFTPCLYCNVSDSWMLPNKWHRVFIGAAGMYVELILASIATYLWWFSQPGMLNFLCLSVMFICSVSTVVFNGNPLLRFDGYYILMDILEIPNLRQKATEILKRWFQKYCLGLELQDNPFLPHQKQGWFALYTVASIIYRWVVVFSIMMFLMKVLEPYGLQALGRLIAISGLAGMIIQPVWQTIKFFRTPGRASKMKRKNVLTSLAVAAAAIVGICWIPLPYHVDCAVEIQPQDAKQVFAMVPGRLVSWNKKPGDRVQTGETIAELESLEMRYRLAQLTSELEIAQVRLAGYIDQKNSDLQAQAQIKTQKELVASKQQLVDQHWEKMQQLHIKSKADGVILPGPNKPAPKAAEIEEQLPMWSGNPFDDKNQDAVFSQSDLLCFVGDPNRMEAVLVVDQHDIDLVHEEIEVDIKIDSARLETFSGKIEKISKMEMRISPENLALQAGGRLDTEMDESGRMRPISTSYQARVPLEDVDVSLRSGYRGQAKIYVGWKSIGWRIYRFCARTFRLEM